MQVNGPEGEKQARKTTMAISVACMAIYWPTPGFKGRMCKLCVLNGWDFNFCVHSSPLRGRENRVLGVTLDEELKWQSHIDSVCKKSSRNLSFLGQHKDNVSTDCRKMLFKVHLRAHINYASSLWSNACEVRLKNKIKLNSLYRRAAKSILSEQSLSTMAKLRKLDLLPLQKYLFTMQLCLCLRWIWA